MENAKRIQALTSYVKAIKDDPRIASAKTGDDIVNAIVACVTDDAKTIRAFGKLFLEQAATTMRSNAERLVANKTGEMLGRFFDWLGTPQGGQRR